MAVRSSPLTDWSTPSSSDDQKSPRRQCWECLGHRWVCDSLRPACTRCRTAGITCPGYGDKKPLTWLAPGKVLSRPRKSRKTTQSQLRTKEKTKHTRQSPMEENTLPKTGWDIMQIRPGVELRSDTCDMVEAVCYYNSQLYPRMVSNQLSANMFHVPIEIVHLIPVSARHGLVSIALSHHILRLPLSRRNEFAKEVKQRLYHHTGQALRTLNADLESEELLSNDSTIASIVVLLIAELQQPSISKWQVHITGLSRIIALRGGCEKLLSSSPHMRPILLYFLIFVTIAGTTSPQISLITPDYHFDTLDFIRDLYSSSVYPTFPCPPSLFLDIITTNNLRFELASSTSADESTHAAISNLLDRINTFSPEDWVQSMQYPLKEWLLVSRIYKCAVALYAMSSLISIQDLSPPLQQMSTRSDLRQQLFSLLQEASACPRAKPCVVWPLVVLGVEATRSAGSQRTFVETELLAVSQESGLCSPLVAKEVLHKFWASSGKGWNACFDQTYALFT